MLKETGLPPHLLCIELTESLLADNAEGRSRTVLEALKGLGVTLALDDFGTDYSSLGYLNQLPFDKLKIDRVFVDGITDSDRARELLRGIVALGRGLGMIVVAEGAEKHGEVDILRQFSCDQAQGYVFARPAVAADALTFARACEARELLKITSKRAEQGCPSASWAVTRSRRLSSVESCPQRCSVAPLIGTQICVDELGKTPAVRQWPRQEGYIRSRNNH